MKFMDALLFRHACKIFDDTKKVSDVDREAIIEFGRLSPSSFGFEPWHFLVISNAALREKIKPTCWDQVQVTTSSFIVIYLTHLPHHFKPNSAFFRQRGWRRSLDEERFQAFSGRVATFLAEQNTQEWAKRQSYIALSNMMTGAASLGIDSCPIEGFDSEKIKAVLKDKVDWSVYDITAVCAFGYRLNEQSKRIREPKESVVTIID
jgi:nitroreductase